MLLVYQKQQQQQQAFNERLIVELIIIGNIPPPRHLCYALRSGWRYDPEDPTNGSGKGIICKNSLLWCPFGFHSLSEDTYANVGNKWT